MLRSIARKRTNEFKYKFSWRFHNSRAFLKCIIPKENEINNCGQVICLDLHMQVRLFCHRWPTRSSWFQSSMYTWGVVATYGRWFPTGPGHARNQCPGVSGRATPCSASVRFGCYMWVEIDRKEIYQFDARNPVLIRRLSQRSRSHCVVIKRYTRHQRCLTRVMFSPSVPPVDGWDTAAANLVRPRKKHAHRSNRK